jgi:hypothetical protein
VYAGERLVERCDPARARQLARASNVEVVRARKTGAIVRLLVTQMVGDEGDGGRGGRDPGFTYSEQLGGHAVTILKLYDEDTGRYVHWPEDARFDPRRFNPDLLPVRRGA